MLAFLIASFLIAIGYIYFQIRNKYKYFEEIGIEYDKATPFLGTFKAPFLKREHFLDNLETIYKRFDSGIIGIFDLNKKAYMVRSPEVIRLITTKYFDHFTDRRGLFNDAEHSLLGNSLFQLRGKKWKDMRTSLSPAFTGSKLRGMFKLMRDISESTIEHLKCSSANEIELKDFLSRYANDVIATTAFGFQINSNKDPQNDFFMTGKEIFNLNTFKLLFITSFSWLAKVLELDFLSKRQSEYYMKLVLEAMDLRKKRNIFRPDMINMLMEMREIGLEVDQRKWSDTELVAQCFSFFAAAFDTVSSTLSFICHELMENQDCQNKLRKEIFHSLELLNGEPVTYEAISSMKYIDAVIFEGMRKWPSVGLLDRICTKDIILNDPVSKKDVSFKVGDNVQLNVIGIQRDPKYFENPMKFDPERFYDANRQNIDPNTILSFGFGPRMCIGNRFALLEMKLFLFNLLKDFSLERHEKSVVPLLKLDESSPKLEPKGGFVVKLCKIG